jgi:hypothetical protein
MLNTLYAVYTIKRTKTTPKTFQSNDGMTLTALDGYSTKFLKVNEFQSLENLKKFLNVETLNGRGNGFKWVRKVVHTDARHTVFKIK